VAEFPFVFNKYVHNTGQLFEEIQTSSVTIALERIDGSATDTTVIFKADLSGAEYTTLSGVVEAYTTDPDYEPTIIVTAGVDESGHAIANRHSPVTTDGEMLTIQSNMANVTGNKLINWTMFYTLSSDTSIDERFVVPSGMTAAIEFVQGYSSAVPYSVELNWYKGSNKRTNPAVNPRDYAIQEVNGAHAGGSTVITLKGGGHGFAFNSIEVNKRYGFATSSGTTFVRTVDSKNGPSKTVTLDKGIPSDLENGDHFALMDRPIARLGGASNNALMDFEVSPTFRGNGTRYLELIIKNESLTDSGDVFAVVNGWTTPTNGGTIPGQGGDSGVDEDA
jgi:hypothetical protein